MGNGLNGNYGMWQMIEAIEKTDERNVQFN